MAADDLPLEVVAMADVAIVLLAGRVVVRMSRRFRQPPVVAEIATGIMLGPSLLGLLPGNLPERIFPGGALPMLSAVAHVGLLLFMFMAGWEMDLGRLRGRGRSIGTLALLAMSVPLVIGAGAALVLAGRYAGSEQSTVAFVLFVSTAFAITAFPVLARIIQDGGLGRTRAGSTAMACAAIGDVLAWAVLAIVIAVAGSGGTGDFFFVIGLTAAYALVMAVGVRPLLKYVADRYGGASHATSLLVLTASGVYLSAWLTSWIGIHAIFGAFAFGLVMPRGRDSGHDLHRRLEIPITGTMTLMLPVFFIVTGMSVDVTTLGLGGAAYLGFILFVAVLGKYAGTLVPARVAGMSWREAGAFSTLMNTRGLTEIIILDVGHRLGVINSEMFTMMVVMALFTTAMAGPVLHRLEITRTVTPPAHPAAPREPAAPPEPVGSATEAAALAKPPA